MRNSLQMHESILMAALLVASAGVFAQTAATDPAAGWPNRPVRFVVPFTAGSATDAVARIVGERLGAQLGQTFVIENAGFTEAQKGGMLGDTARKVFRMRPDGRGRS